MLALSPCKFLCSVALRSCLPGTCHHTFLTAEGKAGVVHGRNKTGSPVVCLAVQLSGWTLTAGLGGRGACKGTGLDLRAGCFHWGCWGRCQARAGGYLGSLEKQKLLFFIAQPLPTGSVVGFLYPWTSRRTHRQKWAWTSAPLLKPWGPCCGESRFARPCLASPLRGLSSFPTEGRHGTDGQIVLRAAAVDPSKGALSLQ